MFNSYESTLYAKNRLKILRLENRIHIILAQLQHSLYWFNSFFGDI